MSLTTLAALVSAGLCVMILGYGGWRRARVPAAIPLVDASEQRTDALKQRLDISAKLFDLGLLLLGALWGLVFTDKYPLGLSVWTNVAVFISSNVLILLSLLFSLLYRRRVSTLTWDLAPKSFPDIFSEHIDYLFQLQWLFFICSLLTGCFTVLIKAGVG
jgi:hypothetical protein